MAQSRQIGPDQPVFLGHARNPGVPFGARFVIAVNEHGRLRLAPRLSKPVLAIEEILFVVLRNNPDRTALRKRGRTGQSVYDRGSNARTQQISTRQLEAHIDTPFWPQPREIV